jgi:hypothetical protein
MNLGALKSRLEFMNDGRDNLQHLIYTGKGNTLPASYPINPSIDVLNASRARKGMSLSLS